MKDRLHALLGPAASRAEAELTRRGFQKDATGKWRGEITNGGGQKTAILVELPATFPTILPRILLPDGHSSLAHAHVERDGHLCIATPSGTVIDLSRPEAVVLEALERAKGILFPADPAAHDADIAAEFMAYWPHLPADTLWSVLNPNAGAGEIAVVELKSKQGRRLLAPSKEEALVWAQKIHQAAGTSTAGFLVPLHSLFLPPGFTENFTLREFRKLLEAHAAEADLHAFNAWLRVRGVPCTIALSAPLALEQGRVLFAADLPAPSKAQEKHAQNGFRPGHVPKALLVSHASAQSISRHGVERFDPAYLLARGGGRPELLSKRVVVVGVGSVGSHVALGLAAAGVGSLRLVDDELLAAGNIQRHALGASQVGKFKVDGMKDSIEQRFPHVRVTVSRSDVLDEVQVEPDAITGCDLVVFALGEETLERALTAVLPASLARVHVWLEPLGLGGHVLLSGLADQKGCYECLFKHDDVAGVVNMASLVNPGQHFQRTLAACSGTFTPYGMADAQRAAAEAVRLACGTLLGDQLPPLLHSWISSISAFVEQGFSLSPRGRSIAPGTGLSVAEWVRGDCSVCRGARE